jgi:hypothetical protein
MIKYFFLRILLLLLLCLGSIFFFLDFEEFYLAYALSIYTGLFIWSVFLLSESYVFHKKSEPFKRNLNLLAGIPVFVFYSDQFYPFLESPSFLIRIC